MGGDPAGRLLRDDIDTLVAEGASLEEIEREVIESASVSEDIRAALWLYAWGSLERRSRPVVTYV
jgi:hypothetical protein